MTGFARAEGGADAWTWVVEARSVNGRTLEFRFRGPAGFDSLERIARDAAQARFSRGQVSVNLQARRSEAASAVVVNEAVLARYVELAQAEVRKGASPPTADGLLALRGVLEVSEEDADPDVRAAIEAAMAATAAVALDGLKAARLQEGAALAPVLDRLVARIEALVDEAGAKAGAQLDAVRERFQRRLSELVGDTTALEERILQEAAVLAVKADVTEELDRLRHHVVAARELLDTGVGVGRRLDFLTQEFMREANTLCSKSATTTLTSTGLELKAVIEQLREQIQNVE